MKQIPIKGFSNWKTPLYEKLQEPQETILIESRLATSKEIRDWCVRGRFTEEAWDFGIHPEELFPKTETKRQSKKRKRTTVTPVRKKTLPRKTNYTLSTKGSGITAETLKYKTYQPEPKGLFCEYYFGPVDGGRCPKCGWNGPITQNPKLRCPNPACLYPGLETRITRRSQMGYVRLAIPCIHPWYAFSWSSPLSTFLGIEPNLLQLIFDFEAYLVHLPNFYDYSMVPPDLIMLPRFSERQLTSRKWIKQINQKNKLRDPIGWRNLIWDPNQWKFIYQFWIGLDDGTEIESAQKFNLQEEQLKTQNLDFWANLEVTDTLLRSEVSQQLQEKEAKPVLSNSVQTSLNKQNQLGITPFGSGGNAVSALLSGLPKNTKYFYPGVFEQWVSEPRSNTLRYNPISNSQTHNLTKGRAKPINSVFLTSETSSQSNQIPHQVGQTKQLKLRLPHSEFSKQWDQIFAISTKFKRIHSQVLLYQGDSKVRLYGETTPHYRALWRSLLQWKIAYEQTLESHSNINLGLNRSVSHYQNQRKSQRTSYRANIESLYEHVSSTSIGKLTIRNISQRTRFNRQGQKGVVKRTIKGLNHWGQIPFGRMLVWKLWFHYTDQFNTFNTLPLGYPQNGDEVLDSEPYSSTKKLWRYDEPIEVIHTNSLKWVKPQKENNYQSTENISPNPVNMVLPTEINVDGKKESLSVKDIIRRPFLVQNFIKPLTQERLLSTRLFNRPVKHSRPSLNGLLMPKKTNSFQVDGITSLLKQEEKIKKKSFSSYQKRTAYRLNEKLEITVNSTNNNKTFTIPTTDETGIWTADEWEVIKRSHDLILNSSLNNRGSFEELMFDYWVQPKPEQSTIFRASSRLLMVKAARSWIRRYRLLEHLQRGLIDPDALILKRLPLLPPTLRPILRLRVGQGRLATSDINFLYRTVILRNNSIQEHVARKFDFDNPELMNPLGGGNLTQVNFGTLKSPLKTATWIIGQGASRPTGAVLGNYMMAHFRRALLGVIENSKLGKKAFRPGNWRQVHPTTDKVSASPSQKVPLVTLADTLKGKYGLLRRHMLGKRADYSGRTVIVSGPELSLEECGLPYDMALGLFRPFLIHMILRDRKAGSIGGAKRLLQSCQAATYRLLESIVEHHPILLNRAPTLHRMGIQAFTPVLIPGFAVQLHPLVCPPFNADFDGDTMAIHLPMSHVARAEAHVLLSGALFPVSPASGDGSLLPSQDIVLGCFALTQLKGDDPLEKLGTGQIYTQPQNLIHGLEIGAIATCTAGWIPWDCPPQGDASMSMPKEIRVQPGGTYQVIYAFYTCIFHYNGKLLAAFTKTTPGHSLIQRALTSGLS